ncbi:MAG TPA: DUF4118 domain-containing protein [Candidatus Binatia bacterium]|jgi:two-component system sensor histidine kinase KdpD
MSASTRLFTSTATGKPVALPPVIGFLVAAALVAGGGVVAALLDKGLGLRDPSLIFLTSVVVTAMIAGLRPSLAAAVLSALVYDYFFTVPYYTLRINDPQDILAIVVFLAVAVITSNLMSTVKEQAVAAEERESRTAALYEFSRELVAVDNLDDLMTIIVRSIATRFGADAILLLPDNGTLKPRAAHPAGATVPATERDAIGFAWAEGRSAPMAVLTATGGRWIHVSLGTIRGEVGVLSLDMRGPVSLTIEDGKLLDAFTQQAGVSLERCLVDAIRTTRPAGDANNHSTYSRDARVRAMADRIERMQQEIVHLRLDASELLKSGESRVETS